MIIRRIQAVEPTKEHRKGEKNNGRVQDSTYSDIDTQMARNNAVRREDQNGHENGLTRLRRIYPRSPRL
jgi:hypothetical protein